MSYRDWAGVSAGSEPLYPPPYTGLTGQASVRIPQEKWEKVIPNSSKPIDYIEVIYQKQLTATAVGRFLFGRNPDFEQ